MANSINTSTQMWRLDTSDIVTTIPICIRMLQMKATAAADEAHFYSLPGGSDATADSAAFFKNLIIGASYITDSDGASAWASALVNDWVHVTNCSSSGNDGWYYLRSATASSSSIIIESGATAFSATGSAMSAYISVYTPTECMAITGDTPPSSSAAFTHPYPLDWGIKGRWFENLSFYEATGDSIDIYCYLR